jgi:hypothetical protein
MHFYGGRAFLGKPSRHDGGVGGLDIDQAISQEPPHMRGDEFLDVIEAVLGRPRGRWAADDGDRQIG